MVRFIYGQYTIVFFDMMILLGEGEAVTNLLAAQIDFVAFKHEIRHYAKLAMFGCILYHVFGEGSNSAIVSGRLANLIMLEKRCSKMFTGIGSL